MTDSRRRTVGERLVGFCCGALVCAIALNLTVSLLKDVLVWLVVGVLMVAGAAAYVWWIRRW